MNDFKFSSITPKRVIIGVVMVIAFIFIYSIIRSGMQSSLGMSGGVFAGAPPSLSMYGNPTSGVDAVYLEREYANKSQAMNRVAGEASGDYAYPESVMSPLPQSPSAPPAGVSKIVKSGNLTLLVKSVEESASQITAVRIQMGGQPGNASFNEYRPGIRSGNITIWIPSDRFDDAMTAVKKLAIRVENESVRTDDVSAQFVDLTARLKNLRAGEAQYVEIMKRSGKISEVLEVMRELNNTRAQIEQIQGQLDYISHQVALSSINISLTQEAVPSAVTDEWRPLTVIKAAVKSALNDMTHMIELVLVFVIKLPVLLITLGFWFLVFWGLWKVARYAFHRLKGPGTTV